MDAIFCFLRWMFLVDAGHRTPIICMQDELTRVPINATKFENKVGSPDVVACESKSEKLC